MRIISIIVIMVFVVAPIKVAASDVMPTLVISEVLVGSQQSAKQEFIELYNASNTIIDATANQWAVQIASSAAKDWATPTRTIYLNGYIYPGSHYLIGSTYSDQSITQAYPVDADSYFASVLSSSGGHIRIIRSSDGAAINTKNVISIDQLEWGSADKMIAPSSNGIIVKSVPPGNSIERTIGNEATASELRLNTVPTPQTDIASQPEITPDPEPEDDTDIETGALPESSTKTVPLITELLPNPKSPQTDAVDEFIELYNPSEAAYNLKGHSLQTKATTPKKYTFSTDAFIEPHTYKAFFITQTKLALSNTQGQISLLDADGDIIAVTAPYAKAGDGLSWSFIDGAWAWTSTQTPGASNVSTEASVAPVLPVKGTPKTSNPKTPKLATSKPKAPKKAKQVTKKVKAKKVKKAVQTQLAAVQNAKKSAPIHTSILVGVLILTILYGLYEYRHDVATRLAKFRRHRTDRRSDRPAAARRRSD